jgi:argininosuccinate synthase
MHKNARRVHNHASTPEAMKKSKKKIVLAYSGGLDTSIIVPWLKEHYDCEVHAYCGDIGQGDDELRGPRGEGAPFSGAVSCRVDDLRRSWLNDYVWPCVRAMTVYEGRYLLGTSMARPILAKGQVDYAKEIGADAVAHGCTGKGNDQVRFELAYQALGPDLEVIAPWRHWDIRSREDALDYADRARHPGHRLAHQDLLARQATSGTSATRAARSNRPATRRRTTSGP